MISLALALLAGVGLTLAGSVTDAIALGLALTTTALGTLLPILRDSGLSSGRFGTRVMAIGSVGEFGPVLAIALLAFKLGFIVSGMQMDVRSLFATPAALLLVPLFLAAGMLSVLLYPMLARVRLRRTPDREEAPGLGFHPVSG